MAKAGFQTAIMAPTEILAQQHAKNGELLSPFGVSVALPDGSRERCGAQSIIENNLAAVTTLWLAPA